MKILVDADACPVKKEIIKVAKEFNIDVIMYIDTSHELNIEGIEVVTVGQGNDAVDFKIIKDLTKGDLVITQDYGLAGIILGKGGNAINQRGMVYTEFNIDRLLFERHIGKKNRRRGIYKGKHKKRTTEDNVKFEAVFRDLVIKLLK